MSLIFLNGAFIPAEEARISPFDRGFTFGEGVYEVCLVVNGKLIDAPAHLARLERSLSACGMAPPPEFATLPALMVQLLQQNAIQNGSVYVQITPGVTPRNFTAQPTGRSTLMMLANAANFETHPAFTTGLHVQLQPDIRWLHRDIKTTMLMPQVMAKRNALANGLADTLFYDADGLTEGASSNVFMVDAQGSLITRPLSNLLLAGCTRARILELAQQVGLTIQERPIKPEDLPNATELFATSATYLIAPILSVNGALINNAKIGPKTRQLQTLYLNFMQA